MSMNWCCGCYRVAAAVDGWHRVCFPVSKLVATHAQQGRGWARRGIARATTAGKQFSCPPADRNIES